MTKPSAAKQTDRVPPQSIELERAVLCACLIDPYGARKIADLLEPDDFYERRHSLIYEAIMLLLMVGSAIDILTVADTLQSCGTLTNAGGELYLAQLSGEISTSAHIEHYAKTVKEKATLRRYIIDCTDGIAKAYDSPFDPDAFINDQTQKMMTMASSSYVSEVQKLSEVIPSAMDQIDRNSRHLEGHTVGLSTGFEDLDNITGGWQEGELIIIGARPSMGKTSLAVDIMRHQADAGIPTVLFSLEMGKRQIAMRVIAAEASINLHRLRQGKLSDSDWKRLSNTITRITEFPIYIDDKSSIGISEVITKANRLIKDKKIQAVYLDYLQLMNGKGRSREQEVALVSRSLKSLARDKGVPVIALSQLGRDVEKRGGDKIPQMSDLRESGSLEQDADVVIFIHRKKQYKHGDDKEKCSNEADIIIAKQRNGPTGTVKLMFNDIYSRFDNLDTKIDQSIVPQHYQYENDSPEEEIPF